MLKAIDYLKKGKSNSERLEGEQHVNHLDPQRKTLRFKRSDDNPELPENFQVGQAIGGGDCFFDSIAQGLKRLKPEMDFTVKSLREVCKRFAQSQLENDQSWLKKALRNEAESIIAYVPRIEFTADDIEQKSESINVLGLISPIWGRSEIEGRIICKEYNVKLHIVEKHVVAGEEVWLDQIVSSEGSRSLDSINYNQENTIHIINRGNAHFEPILSTQEIQHNRQQSSNHDTPEKIPAEEQPKKQERPSEASRNLEDRKKKSQKSAQQSQGVSADRQKRNDPSQASLSQQSSNNQSGRGNQPIDSDDEREKNLDKFLLLTPPLSKESFEQEYRKLYSDYNKPIYYDKRKREYYYTDNAKKNYVGKKINLQKVTSLYFIVLSKVKNSIENGDIDRLKSLSVLVARITEFENNKIERNYFLQTLYDKKDNPIKNTNLIILACKHNRPEVLDYLLNEQTKILDDLSINIGRNAIQPGDQDIETHNAFYYAIRSGNIKLLDTLIDKWPGKYFAAHLEELDKVLSQSYEELKLKNLPLSEEMKIFIEDKLVNLRFSYKKNGSQELSLQDVKERINLVVKNAELLVGEYSNKNDVDERFLFVSRFIAQNLYVLKRLLKSTYDRLPWEEMEFCLVSPFGDCKNPSP